MRVVAVGLPTALMLGVSASPAEAAEDVRADVVLHLVRVNPTHRLVLTSTVEVIMFLGKDPSGDALVTESTNATACMGVCRGVRPWSAFAGYIPRAYLYADIVTRRAALAGSWARPGRASLRSCCWERCCGSGGGDASRTTSRFPIPSLVVLSFRPLLTHELDTGEDHEDRQD
jgi:hypothetical protein